MEHIKTLLDKHEALKSKGLRLTDWDIMEWIKLQEQFIIANIELDSKYQQRKLKFENKLWVEQTLLKEKEWWSDTVVKSKIKKQYEDENIEIIVDWTVVDMTDKFIKLIDHYINQSKRIVK